MHLFCSNTQPALEIKAAQVWWKVLNEIQLPRCFPSNNQKKFDSCWISCREQVCFTT
uniref:Uncharacterized protein n=1 Tax=Oryza brachyantha TaxID=4533 RepID=J3M176_ORYBR